MLEANDESAMNFGRRGINLLIAGDLERTVGLKDVLRWPKPSDG
jgi:hypothetical protein